ncbi:MAG: two component, sigma54 specific, transcriptional regulator, Fis family [Bacteroidetes bacterium]|nr:two component, sigma54 specific, transcriptional regulator, Fis family [Bacteroidota bacterium]
MASPGMIRVLLVDDEDSFRLSIEMALKMTDQFSVRSCNSGESAVEIMQKDQFDVILLDNKMEDMSGLEVLQWMHSQEVQTPAIMITAAGSEAVAVEAMKLGAYDYLRKDQLDIDRLRLAIKSVCERYLFRKQAIESEAEKRLLKEKQKELDSLRLFHDTVNSVGQLLEKSFSDLQKNLDSVERELLGSVTDSAHVRFKEIFRDLHQSLGVISSGVSSMRNLSSVVTHRLEEIQIVPKGDGKRPL